MALATWYSTGTVSVESGSTTVTGSGLYWGDDAIMPGDMFCDPAQPLIPPQRVKEVTADNTLELWAPWPGAALTDAPYEIRYVGIIERSTAQTRRVLEDLGQGNLQALLALAGAEDKLPYFDGENSMALTDFPASARSLLALTAAANKLPYFDSDDTMALADLSAFARTLLDDADSATARATLDAQKSLGFTPVQQGGGAGQLDNKVFIGWDGSKLTAQVDVAPLGALWTDGNSPATLGASGWQRLASGLIIQWGRYGGGGDTTIVFPTTFPNNVLSIVCVTDDAATGNEIQSVNVSGKSIVAFTIRPRYSFGGSVAQAAQPVFWMALGN